GRALRDLLGNTTSAEVLTGSDSVSVVTLGMAELDWLTEVASGSTLHVCDEPDHDDCRTADEVDDARTAAWSAAITEVERFDDRATIADIVAALEKASQ